jgi:hypothetical protein
LHGTVETSLASLNSVVDLLADRGFEPDILLAANNQAELDAAIDAVEAMPAQADPPLDIQVNLAPGTYSGPDISLNPGVTLTLTGEGVIVEGSSPALTVRRGSVAVNGDITLTNGTDAATVLVCGGNLALRGVTVEETAAGNQPAVEIADGRLDLGTVFDPGGHTINVRGAGVLIRNLAVNPVSAVGNDFQTDGQRLNGFQIEDAIDHALDSEGAGLVSYHRNVLFVTANSGSIQRAIDQLDGTRASVLFGGGNLIAVQELIVSAKSFDL